MATWSFRQLLEKASLGRQSMLNNHKFTNASGGRQVLTVSREGQAAVLQGGASSALTSRLATSRR